MCEWPSATLTYPDDAEAFEVVHPWLCLGNTACDHDFLLLLAGLSIGEKREKKTKQVQSLITFTFIPMVERIITACNNGDDYSRGTQKLRCQYVDNRTN